MKTLTAEQTAYVETLNTVAGDITQRIVSACDEKGLPKYAHLFEMWKAFLGGFVCKELDELTELDAEQKAMIEEYNPAAIEKLLTREVIKEVTKEIQVEKIVYQDRVVEVPVQQANVSSSSAGTGVKQERRRFATRTRGPEKNRELMPSERAFVIERFNELQRLLDPDSAEAQYFADTLNVSAKEHGYQTIFPSQLAGYWSVLTKRVCGVGGDVDKYMAGAIKYGKLNQGSPYPVATQEFKMAIMENLLAQKNDAKLVEVYQRIYRNLQTV